MYSRRLSVEDKNNKRKTIGFLLLTVAFLAFAFFYGVPILARMSGFVYDFRSSGEPILGDDTTPPPPPDIDSPESHTNKNNIEISGNSEPGSTAIIHFNNKKTEVIANNEGRFSQTFSLNKGENTLYAYSKDPAGNQSMESRTYYIIQDSEEPKLEILSPKSGSEFYGSRNRQINVEGSTDTDASVQINDRHVILDNSGKFVFPMSLNDGDNTLVIRSSDLAGNETEVELLLKYYP